MQLLVLKEDSGVYLCMKHMVSLHGIGIGVPHALTAGSIKIPPTSLK